MEAEAQGDSHVKSSAQTDKFLAIFVVRTIWCACVQSQENDAWPFCRLPVYFKLARRCRMRQHPALHPEPAPDIVEELVLSASALPRL